MHMVYFLKEVLSTWIPTSYNQIKPNILKKFWHIAIDDVNRSNLYECDSILESSNFHSIYLVLIVDPTLFMVQDLACFCPPCVMEEWETCQNRFYVLPWKLIKLKPNNIRLVKE
jgi:hypothetical protein